MSKPKNTGVRPVEKRGGYGAGKKLVTELKPPPSGPAPGARPPTGNAEKKN